MDRRTWSTFGTAKQPQGLWRLGTTRTGDQQSPEQGSTPSRGCSSGSEPPSNSSSFTWQGLILLAETSAGFVSAGSPRDSPQKALQSREREEEEECGVSDLEQAGHCHLLSMGCDSVALHITGSRSCQHEQSPVRGLNLLT